MIKYLIIPSMMTGCVLGLSPHETCESAGIPQGTESFAHCLALEGGTLEEINSTLPAPHPVETVIESEQITKEIDPETFCQDNGFRQGTAFFQQCMRIAEGRQVMEDETIEDGSNILVSQDSGQITKEVD